MLWNVKIEMDFLNKSRILFKFVEKLKKKQNLARQFYKVSKGNSSRSIFPKYRLRIRPSYPIEIIWPVLNSINLKSNAFFPPKIVAFLNKLSYHWHSFEKMCAILHVFCKRHFWNFHFFSICNRYIFEIVWIKIFFIIFLRLPISKSTFLLLYQEQ